MPVLGLKSHHLGRSSDGDDGSSGRLDREIINRRVVVTRPNGGDQRRADSQTYE
jgi:hypothetical protein